MKMFILWLTLGMLCPPALAATSQQSKMKTCNAAAKAKSLKGEERRAFMKQCLSGTSRPKDAAVPERASKAAPNQAPAQRNKMKTCNAEAKTKQLKGAERRTFMKSCLSGS
jgi:hypothetical protein